MLRPLLLSLALSLVLTSCTGGDGSEDDLRAASVGTVLPVGLPGSIEGRHSYVVLPTSRYDFLVSTPRTSVDTITAGDAGISPEAKEGTQFVLVEWSLSGVPGDTFVMEPPADVSPQLTLLADGEAHDLGALDQEGISAAAVVVAADVDDVSLEIEYDGLTQVIEDAYGDTRADGPNALYHEAVRLGLTQCPPSPLSGDDPRVLFFGTEVTGRVATPVPYYGPLGWAQPGREWVVARVSTRAPLAGWNGRDYVSYETTSDVRVRLDGAAPVELFPAEEGDVAGPHDDGSWSAVAVFDVEEIGGDGPLDVRRVLVATPEDDDEAVAAGAPREIRRVQTCTL
ncbi:hypothetical protein [Nocardioides psychrotolerans]|uniref:hypothetical protein n=1 Tax=Nocardioides psychrotolerans TaxID=1005945 RepID=UPI003137DF4D